MTLRQIFVSTSLVAFVPVWTAIAAQDAVNPEHTGKPNRLIHAQSPYLQQHAYNPVDWYEWGDEPFERARAENKPVLVSIGYSTCHWCHVMNRESFFNPEIAAYLNEHFICIKVDREERPDVDRVYMNFVQRLTGSGGWPLNVWLTPERKPFFGGTYFPPESTPGTRSIGLKDLLKRIHDLWEQDHEKLVAQSEQMTEALNNVTGAPAAADAEIDMALYARVVEALGASYDAVHGGFGGAPKFPMPANLSFLLKASVVGELPRELRERARAMATDTLQKIGRGGIRDHLGGGFHRYTVDAEWNLPHFEKMLYDQALLISAYVDAWRVTKDEFFKNTATETIGYLLRDVRSPEGGFYSAEDAESYPSAEAKEKREGAFYLWSTEQLETVLGAEDAALAAKVFDVHPEGNTGAAGPHQEELAGWNTLRLAAPVADLAKALETPESELNNRIADIKRRLFEAREERPRPFLDNKIIVGWNGLTISALSRAALAFGEPAYAREATRAAEFVRRRLYDPEHKTLKRLFRDEPSDVDAFSEDYAYFIAGLLDLYESTGDIAWVRWADELQQTHLRLFYDDEHGGFFSAPESADIVFAREKESYDGVTPAPSSVAAKNLARLGLMLNNEDYLERARGTVRAFLNLIEDSPDRMPALVDAMAFVAQKPVQLVIASDGGIDVAAPIVRPFGKALIANAMLLHADGAEGQAYLSSHLDFTATMAPTNGHPTAYLCYNFVCQLPTDSPATLAEQIGALEKGDR